MHSQKTYITVSMVSAFAGMLFFAIYNEWIIFKSPQIFTEQIPTSVMTKKQITLFYYHYDKWKIEKQDILWSENNSKDVAQLINAWLTVLDEEHITAKKITLQSALISTSGHLYISFDNSILNKEDSIFKKWMLVEGLLKTIVYNDIAVQQVQFLVQHQQLQDSHLDFSIPWPINGCIVKP